jgi:hypothetical protein
LSSGSGTDGEVPAWLLRRPDVERVEPAHLSWLAAIPSDSLFPNQAPFLSQVTAITAWDQVRGEQGPVVIAIVDGGTEWRHPDLIENIWTNPGEIAGNGIDDDGNGFVDDVRGWNFANDSNDPTGLPEENFSSNHGTHVAGLAGARADNRLGGLGTSWNARILPINASDPDRDTIIAYGYEGILYAAMLGADVINASWARPGRGPVNPERASIFEEDIVDAARALGSLVVVAAGNNGLEDFPTYPAFYRSTLAVAATDFSTPEIWFLSNRDYWVDIAAPGSRLMSTLAGGGYGLMSGTSMASPVVCGIAALVKTAHPDWSPEQIRQQIRWTGRDLTLFNPGTESRLGGGMVQAEAAVGAAVPAPYIASLQIADQDADGLIEGGEVLAVNFVIRNEGPEAQSVLVRLRCPDPGADPMDPESENPYVKVLDETFRLPVMRAASELRVRDALSAFVTLQVPPGQRVPLLLEIEFGGRTIPNVFYPELAPLDAAVKNTGIQYSLTANGKVGFSSVTSAYSLGGVGLRRPGQRSVLLGGGLLVGDGPDRVSDAVQPARPFDDFEDFHPLQGRGLERISTPEGEELRAAYSDRVASRRLGVGVAQRAMTSSAAGREDFVLLSTELTAEIDSLVGVRAGFLVDWEMSYLGEGQDEILVDPAERLVMARTTNPDPRLSSWAGAAVIEGPPGFSSAWLWDIKPAGASRDSALYDAGNLTGKPSDAAMWAWLEGAPDGGNSPIDDVGSVFGVGPFSIARGEKKRFVVAWLLGESEEELRSALHEARLAWTELRVPSDAVLPTRPEFLPTVPNPIADEGLIRFRVPVGTHARLRVVDLRGRTVRELLSGPMAAGVHRVRWVGVDARGVRVARGVYHLVLQTDIGDLSQPVVWWGH